MIRAVIFDLDDTLYDEHTFVTGAFAAVAEYLAEYFDADKERIAGRMEEILLAEGRGAIFNRVCEELAAQHPEKGREVPDIPELVEIYRNAKPALSLYPDAEQLLRYLKEKGICTGLITDGCARVQHAKAGALGLSSRLDSVVITDDLVDPETGRHRCKPDPAVYQTALDRMPGRIFPEEAVYVGDNPGKDFIGARILGMKTVRIVRPRGDHMSDTAQPGTEADHTVELLTRIPDVLGL